ncbi:MAG: hypothetical protein J2P41_20345, partial [Blastocatellia bacterium]|nr:hypothetical protein [Blastocatellia bacterium]
RPRTDRQRLAEIVHYRPVQARPWSLGNSKHKGLETYSARFDFSNGLSATAVFLKAMSAEPITEVTLCLNDKGKMASAEIVSDCVNRGEAVVAADLLFTGDCVPRSGASAYTQMLAATGDRPWVSKLRNSLRWPIWRAHSTRLPFYDWRWSAFAVR